MRFHPQRVTKLTQPLLYCSGSVHGGCEGSFFMYIILTLFINAPPPSISVFVLDSMPAAHSSLADLAYIFGATTSGAPENSEQICYAAQDRCRPIPEACLFFRLGMPEADPIAPGRRSQTQRCQHHRRLKVRPGACFYAVWFAISQGVIYMLAPSTVREALHFPG